MFVSTSNCDYKKIFELAYEGYTAVTIAERLNIDIITVSKLMPTKEEREDYRAFKKSVTK